MSLTEQENETQMCNLLASIFNITFFLKENNLHLKCISIDYTCRDVTFPALHPEERHCGVV